MQLRQSYKRTTAAHPKTQTVHNIVFKQSSTLKHSKDKSEWINCWSSLLLKSFIPKSTKLEGYLLFWWHTYEKKDLSSQKLNALLYWCSVKFSHKITVNQDAVRKVRNVPSSSARRNSKIVHGLTTQKFSHRRAKHSSSITIPVENKEIRNRSRNQSKFQKKTSSFGVHRSTATYLEYGVFPDPFNCSSHLSPCLRKYH